MTPGEQESDERGKPLGDRLKRRFGVEVDPEIALPASEPDQAEDISYSASGEILARLQSRGEKVTRYKLTGEIARGGMGAILKVWDEDLRRDLAMKVMLGRGDLEDQPRAEEADPKSLGRFMEEAQITGQLDHPGIIPVHELGLDSQGRVFFTMQLVRGRDLNEIFQRADKGEAGWNTTRVLGVILRVCEAMSYAHAKGVIHRDLKPANIMVGRFGEVYVMDWGLARILGREDTTDIRVKTDTTHFNLLRGGSDSKLLSDSVSHDPLRTMDGDVVGTPSFMSPEQARGMIAQLDARTDVYSVGSMLYRLLGGRSPFVPPGAKVSPTTVLVRLLEGPPTPLLELNPDIPGGRLAAICEKAMARAPSERYADMSELAEDLRAYLEQRVVRAYRTGAAAELKKWVARNRGLAAALAAALLAVIGGLAAVGYVQAEGRKAADVQRAIADANATQAQRERANVMRLSAFQDLEDLQAEADGLWPAEPAMIGRYRSWLDRAANVVAGLYPSPDGDDIGHYAQLEDLQARALELPPIAAAEARRAHPRYAEWRALADQLEAARRADDVRAGRVAAVPHSLDLQRLPTSPASLNTLAWPLVDPAREEFGRETEGLALARLAIAGAATSAERALIADTLAWALFANGLDEEARTVSAEALELAPAERKQEFRKYMAQLEAALAAASGEEGRAALAALTTQVETLEAEISHRRAWSFVEDEDRWWHAQLEKLVEEIEAFADEDTGLIAGTSERWGWGIDRRLEFASQVEELTLRGEHAKRAWDEAIELIGNREFMPQYDGLVLSPQLGLSPLGPDPRSGLWEFAHPLTGEIPFRGDDGSLVLNDASCLVFVLIPPGRFTMGAQASDPNDWNYDPQAEPQEGPVHEVALDAFFLSKFEMTQGQWKHFAGHNPSRYDDTQNIGRPVTLRHPVEQVSWVACAELLDKAGLRLPTEAQWEYAARAGTETPWWTGDERETLVGHANFADRAAAAASAGFAAIREWPDFHDGWPVHAPVDSFPPNGFGLLGVLGNVFEWCREGYVGYDRPMASGDGEREVENPHNRVFRGASFIFSATRARSASRGRYTPDIRANDLGLRPAREIRP